MNSFIILLVYLLKIRNQGDFCEVKKIFFLKNNFWFTDQEQLETDKGYLYEVGIDVEWGNGNTFGFYYHSETCNLLKSTSYRYIVLENSMIEGITSVFKSSKDDKFLCKFHFLFTDEPIKNFNDFINYEGRRQNCVSYKFLEKMPENENCGRFRCDGIDVCMRHIKDLFEELIEMKLLKFNDYIENLGEDKLKNELSKVTSNVDFDANFQIYYLQNSFECLENLKEFIKDLCYFKLIDDHESSSDSSTDMSTDFTKDFYYLSLKRDDETESSSDVSIDETTTLKVSIFKECLYEKFYENLKKLYDIGTNNICEQLFDECFSFIKNEMLENNIFLPVSGEYNINFYIDQLSNFIYELMEKNQVAIVACKPENKSFLLTEIVKLLKNDLENLQVKALQNLCESEYITKHFSKLFKKEVKTLDDFKEVEKMVCDYYNMFVFIFVLYHGCIEKDEDYYCSPIFIDNYDLNVIDGMEIKFEHLSKFGKLRGFDDEGKEIIMKKDTDYFIHKRILYCPSDVLKIKNIREIEIISSDNDKNNMRLKVDDYLIISQ